MRRGRSAPHRRAARGGRAAALLAGVALFSTGALLSAGADARTGRAPLEVVTSPGDPAVATVFVQQVPVARLRGPNAEARAAVVARRLGEILPRGGPYVVAVRARGRAADLSLNGRHVVTVDEPLAQAAGAPPLALAQAWAARLREALERNTVTLSPSLLVLRPGERALAAVSAFLPGAVQVGPHDQRVAAARLAGGAVEVEARAPGSTSVPITVGGGQAVLPVVVRIPAGRIPEALTVRVTGELPSAAVVREAVQRRVELAVSREPGASVLLGPIVVDEAALAAPEGAVIPVAVRVSSPYALPVEGTVRVAVLRETVRLQDPALLLVSNRPEAIQADGVLFEEVVDARHPIRLLYHHQNGSPDRARVLTVALTNRSGRPAELLVIGGLAGPSPDPLYVGFAATTRFLQHLAAQRGYVLEIPPRSTYAYTAQTMAPLQLVSGILQLQLLAGEELEVRLTARLPWILDRTVAMPINQIAYPHPKGVFAAPTVEVARTVELLQPVPLVDLGWAAALRDERTGERLSGDYGVLYRIAVTAVNPASQEVTADLVATAAGGAARGVFLIDGRWVDFAVYRGFEERTLATIVAPAGEQVTLQILTMPTAGSFYPVRLSLRPRG